MPPSSPPTPDRPRPAIVVVPGVFRRGFAATILGLLVASSVAFTLHRQGIRPSGYGLFYVDLEFNVPAVFSAAQLLLTCGLLAIITADKRRRRDPFTIQWGLLAMGFLFLSIDELGQIHELMNTPMRSLFGGSDATLFHPEVVHGGEKALHLLFSAWVVPGALGAALIGLLYQRFLAHLPAARRRRFVVAGAIFVGGAVGLEAIGGWYVEQHGYRSWGYGLETHIEEGMEMFGIMLFNCALLEVIGELGCSWPMRVNLGPAPRP